MHFTLVPSTGHGINYLLFSGSLLGNTLPREIKESNSTEVFKEKLKEIGNLSCTCTVVSRGVSEVYTVVSEVYSTLTTLKR